MGKCKTCGKKCEGDYCFSHKPPKPMHRPNTFRVPSKKIRKGSKLRVYGEKSMKEFFMTIWNKRLHKSEISQLSLGKEPSTGFFHHILPKSKYPDLAYIEENIILLTLDEHANVESDIYKYEKINKIRTELTLKYLNHE
jgi:hypothetical protein